MSRRLVATTAVSGCLLLIANGSYAEETPAAPPPEPPRPGCTRYLVDASGDAAPKYVANTSTAAVAPSRPALDVRGLHIRVTPDTVYLLAPLGAEPTPSAFAPYESAIRYTLRVKMGAHLMAFTKSVYNPAIPVKPVLDQKDFNYLKGGAATTIPGATERIRPADPAAQQPAFVEFVLPRAALETIVGTTFAPDDVWTELGVTSQTGNIYNDHVADEPDQPVAERTKVVGEDFCFGPAPSSFSALTTTPVQYGDSTTLSVTLKGGDKDEPLADRDVVFIADAGTLATSKTNAAGLAGATIPVSLLAGSYPFAATFAGSSDLRPASLTGSLVVKPEVTVMSTLTIGKPSTKSRTATATVLDDDKKPVTGQKVDWYVNNKKVATTTTDATGKTTYKALKPGQTVQAKFPLVLNTYTASASKAVKV